MSGWTINVWLDVGRATRHDTTNKPGNGPDPGPNAPRDKITREGKPLTPIYNFPYKDKSEAYIDGIQ